MDLKQRAPIGFSMESLSFNTNRPLLNLDISYVTVGLMTKIKRENSSNSCRGPKSPKRRCLKFEYSPFMNVYNVCEFGIKFS